MCTYLLFKAVSYCREKTILEFYFSNSALNMVGLHKYLLKNYFNFFSLNLIGTDEMQYKKTRQVS